MQEEVSDTIVAIATKLGVGAISIIRVSGTEAIPIVNKIFSRDLEKVASHTISYGYIINKKEKIDEVLVSFMKAPKTFTREDVVEINCHGGIETTLKVFELLQQEGARLAEPGEFTKRAFLNGRIDLTEAEAVMDIINSKTEEQRKMAMSSLEGHLKNYINSFRERLKHFIANIEVNIDYPEYQDIEEVTKEDIKKEIERLEPELKQLIKESREGQVIKNGIKTVIIGRPNVGKSSILNAFLQKDKAIVTDIEGTTRDIIEGNIIFDGIELSLIDTAGIRDTDNLVEKIGVEKSLEMIKQADLILAIFNAHEPLNENDRLILSEIKDKNSIIVLNKNDLKPVLKKEDFPFSHVVSTNTTSFEGILPLKDEIKKMFSLDLISEKDTFLTTERQIVLAEQALNSLEEAKRGLKEDRSLDMIEIDLQDVLSSLGSITGESYDDELLDTLFANFCVGK
ncbi:MAG TPA: tRNA uridine-5-carboxymethylaminomethyl(34) synthesis GTPase MnmE [Candidatus Onthousia faecigallinarum]|nr:tRNA uridine-5-carboxymethylaminomethyl(34) synthesis GTPase MnmE [Candidatus Onthousia faecigallinarum]